MCSKRPLSKEDAQQALYWIRSNKGKKSMRKRKECRHYWCGECEAFHLTSKEKYQQHGEAEETGEGRTPGTKL